METRTASASSAVETFFNAVERVVLFALSVSVGLINLMIGLVMAAHLGVIPKSAAGPVLRVTGQATALVTRIMAPSPGAPSKHKAKP
ncbi:MAG: hypothetical protein ACHQ49_13110 [Elusimicrobiota bacterium]